MFVSWLWFLENKRAKNSVRAFTFNLLNIEDKAFFRDSKHIRIIKELRKDVAILKPDKGNGVVLIDIVDYQSCLAQLFEDSTKFRKINTDPTYTRLKTLQSYLNTLRKRNEINETQYKEMRRQNAKPARSHGLPKTHKEFDRLPKFRPIIDTTGSTHYNVGKFLTKLLNPLTINDYAIKDTFDAVHKINNIPKQLYEEGYVLVSFDVCSLFTNVPLSRTINIILKRIYHEKLIDTSLKRRTLKKLIKDTCQKTVFSCNNQLYEQIDGVSMGSSMGPVLASIIMTEFEKLIVQDLISNDIIKFYGRYVDDTLLVVRPENIPLIHERFNSFDPNIQFTIDQFENEVPHFLDIEISPDGVTIFRKDTNTGQYTNFSSYTNWSYKIAWIRSLVTRAIRVCSQNKLKKELSQIKKIASWNGFPKFVCNGIINRILKNREKQDRNPQNDQNEIVIWLKLPYVGDISKQLVSSLQRRL